MRFNYNEITLKRISNAFLRRIKNIPNVAAWYANDHFRDKLQSFYNIHKGERCFIIANGPSIKKTDLSLLKDKNTIGMNRIYMLFDEMSFETTYYTVVNELVIEQFYNEIEKISSVKFINWNQRKLFNDLNINYLHISSSLKDSFSKDLKNKVYSGGTVTYVSLQLAYFLGFSEVILVGLDHNFIDKGTPNKVEVRKEDDQNHFHPNYFPKGSRWELPDLHRSELAYELAKKMFEGDGRKIYDATIGGKCEVFEKIDYYSLFSKVISD